MHPLHTRRTSFINFYISLSVPTAIDVTCAQLITAVARLADASAPATTAPDCRERPQKETPYKTPCVRLRYIPSGLACTDPPHVCIMIANC